MSKSIHEDALAAIDMSEIVAHGELTPQTTAEDRAEIQERIAALRHSAQVLRSDAANRQ